MPLNVDSLNAGTISQNGEPVKPYKVYTALLTQSGTDAPVATVLENTLGVDTSYVYGDTGQYQIVFSENINIMGNVYCTIKSTYPSVNNLIKDDSTSGITIQSRYFTGNTSSFVNNALYYTEFEIRVYN